MARAPRAPIDGYTKMRLQKAARRLKRDELGRVLPITTDGRISMQIVHSAQKSYACGFCPSSIPKGGMYQREVWGTGVGRITRKRCVACMNSEP